MPSLDLSGLTKDQVATGTWAAVLLHALARDEASGRRAPRLTEPNLNTWSRFRGRLTSADLIALLFEDASVIHPIPFDAATVGGAINIDRLPTSAADAWLKTLSSLPLASPGADYVADQARMLGLTSRMARSELHVVKPHQRVLELPGTGGQLSHHIVATQKDVTLQDNFLVACGSWQELTLAGVIALELGAPHSGFAVPVDLEALRKAEHPLRQKSFDFVIGLHPDKGGQLRIENELAIWFPTAKVVLV